MYALQVLATNGDTHLGGEDFDQRVMQYFMKLLKKKTGADITGDNKAIQKLRREVRPRCLFRWGGGKGGGGGKKCNMVVFCVIRARSNEDYSIMVYIAAAAPKRLLLVLIPAIEPTYGTACLSRLKLQYSTYGYLLVY